MPMLKKNAPKKAKKARMHTEMSKFKKGDLKSSSGDKVTNPKQAVAIGMSESGMSEKKSPKMAAKKPMPKKNRPRNKGRS